MKDFISEIIHGSRQRENMTQDEFGRRYGISGPAVFKFENAQIRPSLELWLKIAADAGIPERRSIILWIKAKLPEPLRHYVELQVGAGPEDKKTGKRAGRPSAGPKKTDYSKCTSRRDLLAAAAKDAGLPQGLRGLLASDEQWALYKPTGLEVNMLRDIFAPIGNGTVAHYRDALRLIREFSRSN
jgi:transcriptional regulator with XRE-family HTH domain